MTALDPDSEAYWKPWNTGPLLGPGKKAYTLATSVHAATCLRHRTHQISLPGNFHTAPDIKPHLGTGKVRSGAYAQEAAAVFDILPDPACDLPLVCELVDVGDVSAAWDDEECAGGLPWLVCEEVWGCWLHGVVGEEEEAEGEEGVREREGRHPRAGVHEHLVRGGGGAWHLCRCRKEIPTNYYLFI